MRKVLLFLLFAISIQLHAQSDDFTKRLVWKVSGVSNTDNSTDQYTSNSEFVTQGTNTIQWLQKGGAIVYNFDVTQKSGNWKDSKKDGELLFAVMFRGHAGKIKFSRRQGQVKIETNIPIEGKNTLPFVFTIDSISML